MFLSYLIDPMHRSIEKVVNGFDHAVELIGSDELLTRTLWQATWDADSLVDVISSADPDDDSRFRLCLTYDRARLELVVAGRGVLLVCGEIPEELARQVRDAYAIET